MGEKGPRVCCGVGRVYSYTRVYDAPRGYEHLAPYYLAMILLKEGVIMTAILTDLDRGQAPEIDMRVEMVTRRIRSTEDERGLIVYGYMFRPIFGNGELG